MPNTKSAKKRLRQSLAQRTRNRAAKRDVKSQVTKVVTTIQAGKLDEAQTEFRLAAKKLDQAAAGRKIHRNAAARLKSRLAAKLKAAAGK
jgi:small subunit ribosomal protein S20